MKFQKINKIEDFGYGDTYDLEVDHTDHTFYANDISVSNSHSIAYGYNSYITAWLLTYYEAEWICAYIETQMDKPNDKVKAVAEIKSMGYEFSKTDINHAIDRWTTINKEKKLMPSLTSYKGLGKAAYQEISKLRPYSSIYEFLWKENGEFRHSKFNKRNMDVLIKVEAFDSLNCVGEGKLFKSYAHMHRTLISDKNWDLLKKKLKKDTYESQILKLDNLAAEVASQGGDEDWPIAEKLEFYKELTGETNIDLIIDKKLQQRLIKKGYMPIDQYPEDESGHLVWFILEDYITKKTKKGDPYFLLTTSGATGRQEKIYLWQVPSGFGMHKNMAYRGWVKKSDFGFSTTSDQILELPR